MLKYRSLFGKINAFKIIKVLNECKFIGTGGKRILKLNAKC